MGEETLSDTRERKSYRIHKGQRNTMKREAEDVTDWVEGSAEIVDAYMDDSGEPVLVFEGEPVD